MIEALLAALAIVGLFVLFVCGFVALIMFLWKPNENPEPVEHDSNEFEALWAPKRDDG